MILWDIFQKKNSGEIARNRLKLLLVSDRANCSPEILEMIKNDMIQTISKYMDVDVDRIEIQITQTDTPDHLGKVPALYANIPIRDLQTKGSIETCH